MTTARIYVASSWRNEHQPEVVEQLRNHGFAVYDFRNPTAADYGFNWREIDPNWEDWDFTTYHACLSHPIAERGFESDMYALRNCDACVLVLPCGRSAHLELGWCCGAGKYTIIYNPPGVQVEPELMTKMVDFQTDNFRALNYELHDRFGYRWREAFPDREEMRRRRENRDESDGGTTNTAAGAGAAEPDPA